MRATRCRNHSPVPIVGSTSRSPPSTVRVARATSTCLVHRPGAALRPNLRDLDANGRVEITPGAPSAGELLEEEGDERHRAAAAFPRVADRVVVDQARAIGGTAELFGGERRERVRFEVVVGGVMLYAVPV